MIRVAVISAKNHKRQRRKRKSVTAKREKSQTPKVLTAILTLPNLTWPNLYELWRLRLFSFGGYGLALAALALVVFGAIECPPYDTMPPLWYNAREFSISWIKKKYQHFQKQNDSNVFDS